MEETEIDEGGATTGRRREILALVEARGFVTIDDLARQFDVSAQTIRRDIIRLDEQGLLQRFHGGAGLPEPHRRPAYRDKQARDVGAKARIAACAATFVPEGAVVYLDVGTTAEAVARALTAVAGLTVVTNSLHVAEIVGRGGRAEVRVLGGRLMGPDGSLAGAQTVESLRLLRLDLAIVACSGFDADGAPMDFDPEKIAVKRTACARARRSLLVADASKFAREAAETIVPADRLDLLVTDSDPGGAIAVAFAERLVLAPPAR